MNTRISEKFNAPDYKNMFEKFVTLDFETTGFQHGVDEVLACGVINQDGEVLIDTLVKPVFKTMWQAAEKVNHISPEMVFENGIEYADLIIQLYPIFNEYKNIVIYNVEFDIGFLPNDLKQVGDFYCAMKSFVSFTNSHPNFEAVSRYQKQFRAADMLGIDYSDINLHKAVDDAELCRRIWAKMIELSDDVKGNFIESQKYNEMAKLLNAY